MGIAVSLPTTDPHLKTVHMRVGKTPRRITVLAEYVADIKRVAAEASAYASELRRIERELRECRAAPVRTPEIERRMDVLDLVRDEIAGLLAAARRELSFLESAPL